MRSIRNIAGRGSVALALLMVVMLMPVVSVQAVPTNGSIGGVVSNADGPLQGIDVSLFKWNGLEWEYQYNDQTTDANGKYRFYVSGDGDYRVRFRDFSNHFYHEEWYDDVTDRTQATTVTVSGAADVTGIDATMSPGGSITGRVTNIRGDGVPNINVWAYYPQGGVWSAGSGWYLYGVTDADGYYTVSGAHTSEYRLWFYDNGANVYETEWYAGASNIAAATSVIVTAPAQTSGIDMELQFVDQTPPEVNSDVKSTYAGSASIEITATDVGHGDSGIYETYYKLDSGSWVSISGATATVEVATAGDHTISYKAKDNAWNESGVVTKDFKVEVGYVSVAGANRYETAVKTSQETFEDGTADCVVIATGANWPDALGGAALAAAKNGPILLTPPSALPSGVIDEIRRLGAKEAIILGGTGAVSEDVENALKDELGANAVDRIGGPTRYQTADLIAAATIAELKAGAGYDGTAFVATGANFPDALAGSPLAAAKGWPIFLSPPSSNPPVTTMSNLGVTDALILGGEGVVSKSQRAALEAEFGSGHVQRLAGADRYATGVAVASYGVDSAGLTWNGLAFSTGQNFPDALAGGVLTGKNGSVMLLTASASLPGSVRNKLVEQRDQVVDVYYLGGTGAISQSVRDEVGSILH